MGRYRVVGNHAVEGVEPGGTVKIPGPPCRKVGRARRLFRAGHIAPVDQHRCPVEGCTYEGTERGLASHSRVHKDDDEGGE